MSSSTDWMPNGGAPLLPKVLPYCVPERQMELKRRPTIYDIRGSAWQMRHYKAPIDAEVPWERVHFWPSKDVHVITEQEVIQPPMPKMTRTRTRTVAQKGPKVVKAPPTPIRAKKVAPKFTARYDYWRVFNYVKKFVVGAQVDKGAVEAAPADAPDVVQTTPPVTDPHTLPGAIFGEDEAAADVDAQTESAADGEAQLSLLAAIFKFGVDLVLGQRKRAHEDDDTYEVASGDAKRRRVGSDAQAPSCAEARPAAGNAACKTTTGTTVPKYHFLTAVAAQRRDRRKPKPSRALCPPPTDDGAAGEGNAKVVKAPLPARPIAGRPTRKRADTPDPRVGTPPPSEREASSAPSTPTSSPLSSRASTPERESSSSPSPSPSPSPAPKSGKSKSKSKSSSSKSTSSSSKSKSTKSSKDKSSSDSELSSSKSKSSSKPKTSSDKSKSSSSGSKSSSASKASSFKAQSSSSKAQASSSKTQPSSSKSRQSDKHSSSRSAVDAGSRPRPRSGTEIMLFPHFIYWNRDDKLANPWDPRCAAAPDPLFPWAPASQYWANARCAPIAPLPETPSPPSFKLERAPANPLYTSSTAASASTAASGSAAASGPRRDRSPSPAREREREELSGFETEVESCGEETDSEE